MNKQAFRIDPSSTASFAALKDSLSASDERLAARGGFRAVVIGGGTGAPVSIRTLLSLGVKTSAVVAMADDGGSTGILRDEADVTPPGDVRKCIAAFARNPEDPLVKAFKCRIAVARNHALGNLVLAALEVACGSFPEAIELCEKLLDAQGHVYPSTLDHVTLSAVTRDGARLDGQAVLSHSHAPLRKVELHGPDGSCENVEAYGPALEAVRNADLIVLGPGSLFTSIVPNLLVPGMVDAIRNSRGRVAFVCSLADMQGETRGMSAREHVQALYDHGMEGLVDYVLVHSKAPLAPAGDPANVSVLGGSGEGDSRCHPLAVSRANLPGAAVPPVPITYADLLSIQASGPVVLVRDFADPERPSWHDPLALRAAFQQIIGMICRYKD